MDPAASSMFTYVDNDKEELDDMFGPLKMHNATRYLFVPINDNANPSLPSGGSHWTLLMRDSGNSFVYLDSGKSHGSSAMQARIVDISRKIQTLCSQKGEPQFTNLNQVPQQQNMYDCGVYVLCFIEFVIT